MTAWYWEKVSVKSGEPISVTQFGPLSTAEIVAAVERGEIGATTRVSNDGGERWKSAASFEELADALGLDGRKTPKRTPTSSSPGGAVASSLPVASSWTSESVAPSPSPDERVLPSPLNAPSGDGSRPIAPSTPVASSLSVAPSSPSVESAPKNWRWRNAQGTASEASTLADLIAAVKRGEIVASTQVSNDGKNWKSAADVPALANALGLDVSPTAGAGRAVYPPQKKGVSGSAIAAIVLGVFFVLFILVAIGRLLPAVQAAREAARRMHCTNNMKMIMLATMNYADVNDGALPAAYTVDEDGKPLHSWRVALLPYLEESELYEQIRLDEPWDSAWNSQFHDQMPAVFACPSSVAAGQTDAGTPPTLRETTYSVVVGDGTAFPGAERWRKWEEITDGPSNTLALVERKTPVCWMDPTRELTLETLAAEVGSKHTGMGPKREPGFNAAMLDGSVRRVVSTTDAATLNAWATAAGGEETSEL